MQSHWHVQGTGTADEMALEERTLLATEGIVVAAVEVARPPPPPPAESAADGAADTEQVLVCPFRSVNASPKR